MGTAVYLPEEVTVQERRIDVFLQPGEQFWGDKNNRIWTVLGSCVAVCLYNEQAKVGGMNHILLPGGTPDKKINPDFPSRYADDAMIHMADEIKKLGLIPKDFKAKLFGGGNRLKEKAEGSVGDRNLKTVLDILKEMNIPVVAQDYGGSEHRKIIFDLDEGRVWVKRYTAS